MAKKENKISISKLEEAVSSELKDNTVTIEWNGLSINVRKRLSLEEVVGFVASVVENCIGEDEGSFTPEVKDCVLLNNTIEYYTNITLPQNIDKRYDILCVCRPMVLKLIDVIDSDQYGLMVDAINQKIDYMSRVNVTNIMNKMEEMYTTVESFKNTMSDILDGVDSDSVMKTLESIASSSSGARADSSEARGDDNKPLEE